MKGAGILLGMVLMPTCDGEVERPFVEFVERKEENDVVP